ncbi:MAG: phosphatidate cytidylyltransferase [Anaerolineae bacterium]|nr:phosphatidate cytidylyltransferase [Anaerolineae bacterium]
MLESDLIGLGLFIGYFLVAGLTLLLLKMYFNPPFEIVRKMYHMVIPFSIFPLLTLFSTWYMAVLAASTLALVIYPVLAQAERFALYKRFAVEREGGEFKRSLLIVQLSLASLVFIFWGLLGDDWKYVVVVAVMAWGLGDAAAALVGKAIGRRRIRHPWIEGTKTCEGTLAMFIVAWLAIFLTLLIYAGQSWQVSLAVATLVAPVSAAVELFSHRGMDTLTVPLSTAFAILPLMSFFSLLSV